MAASSRQMAVDQNTMLRIEMAKVKSTKKRDDRVLKLYDGTALPKPDAENELSGILQKKSRYGVWQRRFFKTKGSYIRYYSTIPTDATEQKTLIRKQVHLLLFNSIEANGSDIIFNGLSRITKPFTLRCRSVGQAHTWASFLQDRVREAYAGKLDGNGGEDDAFANISLRPNKSENTRLNHHNDNTTKTPTRSARTAASKEITTADTRDSEQSQVILFGGKTPPQRGDFVRCVHDPCTPGAATAAAAALLQPNENNGNNREEDDDKFKQAQQLDTDVFDDISESDDEDYMTTSDQISDYIQNFPVKKTATTNKAENNDRKKVRISVDNDEEKDERFKTKQTPPTTSSLDIPTATPATTRSEESSIIVAQQEDEASPPTTATDAPLPLSESPEVENTNKDGDISMDKEETTAFSKLTTANESFARTVTPDINNQEKNIDTAAANDTETTAVESSSAPPSTLPQDLECAESATEEETVSSLITRFENKNADEAMPSLSRLKRESSTRTSAVPPSTPRATDDIAQKEIIQATPENKRPPVQPIFRVPETPERASSVLDEVATVVGCFGGVSCSGVGFYDEGDDQISEGIASPERSHEVAPCEVEVLNATYSMPPDDDDASGDTSVMLSVVDENRSPRNDDESMPPTKNNCIIS